MHAHIHIHAHMPTRMYMQSSTDHPCLQEASDSYAVCTPCHIMGPSHDMVKREVPARPLAHGAFDLSLFAAFPPLHIYIYVYVHTHIYIYTPSLNMLYDWTSEREQPCLQDASDSYAVCTPCHFMRPSPDMVKREVYAKKLKRCVLAKIA